MYREEMLRRLEDDEDPLELTIGKWEDLVKHLESIEDFDDYDMGLEAGERNCALCYVFDCGCCEGCPVTEAVPTGCKDTYFINFARACDNEDLEGMKMSAKLELGFLEGLRK